MITEYLNNPFTAHEIVLMTIFATWLICSHRKES